MLLDVLFKNDESDVPVTLQIYDKDNGHVSFPATLIFDEDCGEYIVYTEWFDVCMADEFTDLEFDDDGKPIISTGYTCYTIKENNDD